MAHTLFGTVYRAYSRVDILCNVVGNARGGKRI